MTDERYANLTPRWCNTVCVDPKICLVESFPDLKTCNKFVQNHLSAAEADTFSNEEIIGPVGSSCPYPLRCQLDGP